MRSHPLSQAPASARWLTAPTPGAIAILSIDFTDYSRAAAALGLDKPLTILRPSHRRIDVIDDAVLVQVDARTILVMPHGGPMIRQRLQDHWTSRGIDFGSSETAAAFPEARSRVEALALETLAGAASPRAILLLLQQEARWQALAPPWRPTLQDEQRSLRLCRLLRPPVVAVIGAPNAGKSTLTNRLAGRPVSIEWHEPGSTRDHVGVLLDVDGLVVRWVDTPGMAPSSNEIDADSAKLAMEVISRADLLVSLAEPASQWIDVPPMQAPIIRVRSKSDLPRSSVAAEAGAHLISASRGDGINDLARLVRQSLVSDADLEHSGVWLFHPALTAS
ncbi:MAG: GTP-binding protein [Phycisphaerales bacterium]|nr:GTP-binding protein [Phycisphaerales bacterium]